MNQIDALIGYFRDRPSVEKGDLIHRLTNLKDNLKSPPKYTVIEEIKKYDILYLEFLGVGSHYCLVHSVSTTEVRVVVLSSKERVHTLCPLLKDRILAGGYATKTYMLFEKEFAKQFFVKVYESKTEADKIFRLFKAFYKEALKI